MAPSLHETQRWLADLILDPRRVDAGAVDPSAALAYDPDTARIRLGAYTGGYPARLEEALAETFPAVRHVVGADTFRRMVERYLPAVPAGIYNLNDVGAALPAWLATDELARALPLLPDTARLELAVHRAFHATLLPPFDPAPLAHWQPADWEAAVIRFQPGVALVRSRWPIYDVWQARTQPRDTIDIVVDGRPQDVLVARTGYRVTPAVVPAEQAALLERLLEGEPLGAALGRLGDAVAPEAVSAWFAGWARDGLVAGCER
ncbi:MAG TPA: DNA-binding domain-containing protein [Candidatus Limnocylindria bacterium]|nr:DNA-binding domain-containing protein [Candidatus Limnocylindria bacterium]